MATLTRFRRTVSQPTDGSDFFVDLPSAQPDDDYGVFCEEVAGDSTATIEPLDDDPGDRTTSHFRIVTSAALPDGAVIEFIVVHS